MGPVRLGSVFASSKFDLFARLQLSAEHLGLGLGAWQLADSVMVVGCGEGKLSEPKRALVQAVHAFVKVRIILQFESPSGACVLATDLETRVFPHT